MMRRQVVSVNKSSCSTWKLVAVASIATVVQYSWALQISLLSPYVQSLGVPHTFSSLIWVYSAITGMVVQPVLGFRSDRCTSRFGRRRPFIVAGVVIASVAYMLIGFAKDIGYQAGDSLDGTTKPRAVSLFILGFWLLDIANNALQGPCRALLADLCLQDHKAMRTGMSWFSFFMAIGNILGYFCGAYANLYTHFPFTKTDACKRNCANIKSCFFIALLLLLVLTLIAVVSISEDQLSDEYAKKLSNGQQLQINMSFMRELIFVFQNLKRPVWFLLLVTSLSWIGVFPILIFGTDWQGKEVFRGDVMSTNESIVERYEVGVRAGSLGLMLNSVVLALASLAIEPVGRCMGGVKRLWGVGNLILAGGLICTVEISKDAEVWWRGQPDNRNWEFPPLSILCGAWAIFAVLGISLAMTYSIPFAMASIYCSINGGGQGLSLAVLNFSIVIPQMLVAVMAGPLDIIFGGGNLPTFMIAAVLAVISGLLAIFVLPDPYEQDKPSFQPPTTKARKVMIF
ncbi:hypothetical protein EZV62_022324 [Acer yangbiense]|uniref:Major facilitator superfamily (MFS) profile domain-containing protein n=1 Tax=Acer yangbiense TaxID=1000413 RepID=A0A5C7H9I6_9ROSI|nr:hypothetical protein EZV62_022324 [Acer yangbiense]